VHSAELFVGLLVAVVLLALAARRFERLPAAVALVLGGVGAGLLPFAPDITLDPAMIFAVFLPPILYPSAFEFAFEDVRANLRPIGFLAFALVLATIAVVAVVVHVVADVPWAPAFVLGAVLAPTDPVAASAVIRASGAPSRLATILEGESLVNDGTALTALRIAIAAVAGTFALVDAATEFVVVAFGGAAVGAVLGWLTSKLRRPLDELELESAISVLLAYGAFLLAERLGVSGVLAVVLAGYVMGRAQGVSSPAIRVGGASFWAVARFLAESILFLLVGLAFSQVLQNPATRGWLELAWITGLVVAVVLITRLVWMFTVPYVAGLLDRDSRSFGAVVGARERAVLGFSGLRGATSMAAALTIPTAVAGTAFPERSTIVGIAIGAVVALLVIPALGLPAVLRLVGLAGAENLREQEDRARAALAEAALASTDELSAREEIPEDVVARVRERYELRLRRHAQPDADGVAGTAHERTQLFRRVQRDALAAQRARLAELRDHGDVRGELLRDLERELDLDEVRAR
jgi:Na+/H+ antiporter